MKIEQIDKQTYRKHLNIVIIISIIAFAALSLLISQSLIYFFTDRQGTHFWLNVTGVVTSMIIVGFILKRISVRPYMKEVTYVYKLKHQINLITRKLRKIEQAKDNLDHNAIIILSFYYNACYQLYNLDDNTITLPELVQKQNALDQLKLDSSIIADAESYHESMLSAF